MFFIILLQLFYPNRFNQYLLQTSVILQLFLLLFDEFFFATFCNFLQLFSSFFLLKTISLQCLTSQVITVQTAILKQVPNLYCLLRSQVVSCYLWFSNNYNSCKQQHQTPSNFISGFSFDSLCLSLIWQTNTIDIYFFQ